jgi:cytochrome b561
MTSTRPMRSRSIEMFLSIVMLIMGAIFIAPGDSLSTPVNVRLAQWVAAFPGTELRLGFLLAFVGVIRLVALLVNGRWYPTPLARLAGCIAGSFYWTVLVLAYLDVPTSGTPVGMSWPLVAIAFETFSAMKSAEAAFEQDSFGLRGHRRAAGPHRGA